MQSSRVDGRDVACLLITEDRSAHLGWLADLLPNHLPLVGLVFFDRVEQGLALGRGLLRQLLSIVLIRGIRSSPLACRGTETGRKGAGPYVIFREFGIMHVLEESRLIIACKLPSGRVSKRRVRHIPYTNASSHCLPCAEGRTAIPSAVTSR